MRRALPTAAYAAEGRVSEPEYIAALAHNLGVGNRLKYVPSGSDPKSVVKALIAKKKSDAVSRDYWFAVFDHEFDESRSKSVAEARRLAGNNGITCIESNPAFELWLILHFTGNDRPYGSIDDLLNTLRQFMPEYAKTSGCLGKGMSMFLQHIDDAINHANALAENSVYGNSTEMPQMVEVLRTMAKASISRSSRDGYDS